MVNRIQDISLKQEIYDYIKKNGSVTRKQIFSKFKKENKNTIRGTLSTLKTENNIVKEELWSLT